MSNIQLIIEERERSIGSFMVGRLLPFRKKRMVGPFSFIDHMGPVSLSESENFDVPPHPHIGLSTLTFLFEGSIMHRDSVGSNVEIKPGAVNWMTAGKGVVHSERTPEYLRGKVKSLHGLQIWVALPKDKENIEPSFVHVASEDIPHWEDEGVQFKLIAGEAFGRKSPVPVYSPLYMVEIKSTEGSVLDIGDELFGESGLYILEGEIKAEGSTFGPRQILIAENAKLCSFEIGANTTIYLFGGDPFPEERYIYWNFVHSDKEVIEQAKAQWKEQKFPNIEGESDFVPLP
ncbi:MAG: pirin family protein [Lunatimonas sp.]|uniref:pirin family protein n=1 Tax=Lunatimonas sp. TaxID=2060141 RepID=UPI00263BDA43|nr:pirin family protein [Lunatimonas sp.]MCC5939424.1 pirin family protein [Lunatimonas sp.]